MRKTMTFISAAGLCAITAIAAGEVPSDDGAPPEAVALQAAGDGPIISFAQTTIDVDALPVVSATWREVEYYNAGNAPLTISWVDAGSGIVCSVRDRTVNPGQRGVIRLGNVEIAPRFRRPMRITCNASNCPFVVILTHTGSRAP